MTKGQIVFKAVRYSIVLALVGLVGNSFLLQFGDNKIVVHRAEPVSIEIDSRVRAMEEHGEPIKESGGVVGGDMELRAAPVYGVPTQVEQELRDVQERIEVLDIQRAQLRNSFSEQETGDIQRRLTREINQLRMRQIELIREQHPPAAGEPPEFGEPRGGPEDMSVIEDVPFEPQMAPTGFWDGMNAKYLLDKLFTIGWGVGQIFIGAWAGIRFRARKREMMTESQVDRRVDVRLAEEYAKMYPERRKKR